MEHGMAYTCSGIYFFCIYRKICKCGRDSMRKCVKIKLWMWHYVTNYTKSLPILNTLANLPVNANKVYAKTCVFHSMLHEFFGGFKVKFQVLSQMYRSETQAHYTGYPPAINSHDRISKCKFQNIKNNNLMRCQKNLEGFAWELKLQQWNSASMCKFRPIVQHQQMGKWGMWNSQKIITGVGQWRLSINFLMWNIIPMTVSSLVKVVQCWAVKRQKSKSTSKSMSDGHDNHDLQIWWWLSHAQLSGMPGILPH